MDTPSSFGILILLNVVLYQFFFGTSKTFSLIILLAFFVFLGLADDTVKYFKYEKNKRWGLTTPQKLLAQLVSVLVFFILGSTPLYLIPIYLVFVVFILNSFNITDGLDGLVGTVSMYILPTLAYFEFLTHTSCDLINLIVLLFSFLFIFLYFNIKPARVFLGDAGSMPLGLLIALLGLRFHPIPVFILFSLIIVEGFSSLIQLLSIRIFNKKVFVIAPLHLHLLNKGWTDTKIVQRAGIIQLVLSLIALYVFKIL